MPHRSEGRVGRGSLCRGDIITIAIITIAIVTIAIVTIAIVTIAIISMAIITIAIIMIVLSGFRGSHLSHTTCLTQVFFKSGASIMQQLMMILDTSKHA